MKSSAKKTDPEKLHACPKCGRENFTTAGLRSHRCEVKEVSVEVMPAAGKELAAPTAPKDGWGRAAQWARYAEAYARSSVAAQILCGLELLALKKALGETRGKKPHSAVFSETPTRTWAECIKAHVQVSADTAQRWMEMADALPAKRQKMIGADVQALLIAGPSAWSEEDRQLVRAAVEKAVDGESQRQLLLELGISKAPQGSGKKTGKNGPAKKPLTEEEEAIDTWKALMLELTVQALNEDTMTWPDLPDLGPVSRQSLADLLKEIRTALIEAGAKA